MRVWQRLALLTVCAMVVGAPPLDAMTINVAEFRWTTILDPGLACPDPSDDPFCEPTDPFTLSVFALTHIWDGPGPAPTLFDNRLTLPSGTVGFFDLEPVFPFDFDQLAEVGIPLSAAIGVSFLFDGSIVSLSATLTQPDTFAVLQFAPTAQPVPEPGTLVLLGSAAALALPRLVRRRKRAASA